MPKDEIRVSIGIHIPPHLTQQEGEAFVDEILWELEELCARKYRTVVEDRRIENKRTAN